MYDACLSNDWHWRRRLARVLLPLLFLIGGGLLLADLDAQDPPREQRTDEVEEPQPATKPRKKEEVEETEPAKKLTPIRVGDEPSPGAVLQESVPQAVDLASAARRAQSETVKELFRSLELPHDLVTL